jgi:hypothetical protein
MVAVVKKQPNKDGKWDYFLDVSCFSLQGLRQQQQQR